MAENHNVTSYFQSGGITAHTVNVGKPSRQMNDELGQVLIERVPKDSYLDIVAVMGDAEALNFAQQMVQWMKSKGYTDVPPGPSQAIFASTVPPLTLHKNADKNFKIIVGANL